MKAKLYELTDSQKDKLQNGIKAAIAMPLIDCIEDFIWEGVFCYVKDIPIVDPLFNIRSKKLYDVVDTNNRIGWSAKTLQVQRFPCDNFEFVIQRANIFKKREELGFPNLSIDSETSELGLALLKHWKDKVLGDAIEQDVDDLRLCMLLKSNDSTKYGYVEQELHLYEPEELIWEWTDVNKAGLQGIRVSDRRTVYRWYRGQTQFFEHIYLDKPYYTFEIEPRRKDMQSVIDLLLR